MCVVNNRQAIEWNWHVKLNMYLCRDKWSGHSETFSDGTIHGGVSGGCRWSSIQGRVYLKCMWLAKSDKMRNGKVMEVDENGDRAWGFKQRYAARQVTKRAITDFSCQNKLAPAFHVNYKLETVKPSFTTTIIRFERFVDRFKTFTCPSKILSELVLAVLLCLEVWT